VRREKGANGMTSSVGEQSETDAILRQVLQDVLGLAPARAAALSADTGLFGHLPELDSMAVAGLLTEIEDRLDIVIEDDEVDGEMLETFGALTRFAAAKTG
jgi:acyl carrier protein